MHSIPSIRRSDSQSRGRKEKKNLEIKRERDPHRHDPNHRINLPTYHLLNPLSPILSQDIFIGMTFWTCFSENFDILSPIWRISKVQRFSVARPHRTQILMIVKLSAYSISVSKNNIRAPIPSSYSEHFGICCVYCISRYSR